MTALLLGFFAVVWFGWGQAASSGVLTVVPYVGTAAGTGTGVALATFGMFTLAGAPRRRAPA